MIYLFNNKKELIKIIPRENLISATQEIELNGLYTSEVELPLFYKSEKGQIYNHKKSFDNAAFFGHFDRRDKFQMYKIYTRKVSNKNLIVGGIHLFFDEAKAMNIVREKLLTDVDAKTAVNTVFQGTGWVVKDYDTTPLKSIDFIYVTPLEARKTIIESWDVELDFDLNFNGRKITAKNIYVRKKLGKWTGDRYKYGTNILRIEQEQDESEVYTAAIGRGAGSGLEDSVMFTELAWSKDNISKPVGQDYIEIPSATAQYGYYDINGNLKPRIAILQLDEPDRYLLANKTYDWLKQNCVPKVSYSTTVAKIGDYYLGDEIGIIYTEVDITKKARVEKMTINLLNWNKTEIGLGDYSYFKKDKAAENTKVAIEQIAKESNDAITQAKLQFDADFDAQKLELENQINQVNIEATAKVQAAETRMTNELNTQRETLQNEINTSYNNATAYADSQAQALASQVSSDIENAKTTLSNDITTSYNNSLIQAQAKVDALANQVTSDINTAKTTLSNDITTSYNNAVADAQAKVEAAESEMNALITANKQEADNKLSDFSAQIGDATAQVNALDTQVNSLVGDLSQYKTSTNSQLSTLNTQFTDINGQLTTVKSDVLKNAGDISSVKTTVSSHTTDISNLNNQIVLKASKTEVSDAVNAIQVGGRNLYKNSQTILSSTSTDTPTPIKRTFDPNTNTLRIDVLQDVSYINTYRFVQSFITDENFFINVAKGDNYIFSYDLRGQISGTGKGHVRIDTRIPDGAFYSVDNLIAPTNTWFRQQSLLKTAVRNSQTASLLIFGASNLKAGDWFEIRNVKLEYGNKATPYSQAPEDLEAKVTKNTADITVNANEIAKRVLQTDYNALTGQMQTQINTATSTAQANTATIAVINGDIDNIEAWQVEKGTTIQQTADAISQKIWNSDIDSKTGVINDRLNTVSSTVDSNTATILQHTTSINNLTSKQSEQGTAITQTQNAINTKVWQTDITSAVDGLQVGTTNLLYDKGLATNIGTTKSFKVNWASQIAPNSWVVSKIKPSTKYTVSYEIQAVSKPASTFYDGVGKMYLYSPSTNNDVMFGGITKAQYDSLEINGATIKVVVTFTSPLAIPNDLVLLGYSAFHKLTNGDGTTTNEFAQFNFKNVMFVEGTKVGSFAQAPEDTDARITKAEADITVNKDAINQRVTYTDYNAKTGELTTSINNVKQTADSNTAKITTQTNRIDGLTTWTNEKGSIIDQTNNAITQKIWNTDINNATGILQTQINSVKSTADGNSALITSVKGTVDSLNQWKTEKGSLIDQTINAVSTKVWTSDLNTLKYSSANLLYNNALALTPILQGTTKVLTHTGWSVPLVKTSWITEKLKPSTTYTMSYDAKLLTKPSYPKGSSVTGAIYLHSASTTNDVFLGQLTAAQYDAMQVGDVITVKNTFTTPPAFASDSTILIYTGYHKDPTTNATAYANMEFGNLMITESNTYSAYVPAPEDAENTMSEIKQTADSAKIQADAIGKDYVKQSGIVVQSDGVMIGSKKVSGTEIASAISVTPSNVDIITRVMRVTGDMQVAGDIKSLSLSAVYADIGNLRANVITADSVTASALKVDQALIDKLNVNSLLANKIIADSAMISAIKANAITAVDADIARIRTNILTADSVTATAIKADQALIDKLNVNSLLANKIIADTAMINAIKTNAITAVRADVAWLKANIITADSITATALKVDTALIDKLNTNSILTNEIIADTAYINNVKTLSLEAVYADIANLKANIITADSITATAIKSDLALIDKIFISDAYISRLTSKAAFIRDVEAIDILTRRLRSVDPNNPNRYSEILPTGAYFKGGSVTIETSSGRKVIINGSLNRSQTTTQRLPSMMSSEVEITGNFYSTYSTSYVNMEAEYFVHEARYFVCSAAVNQWGYSDAVDVVAEVDGIGFTNYLTSYNKGSGTIYGWLKIDIGEPLDVPVSKMVTYRMKVRGSSSKGRAHLANRFVTDNPPTG